jgi:hypothetical protein
MQYMIDWGSFPDWLAGAGSVLALVFAAMAARAAFKASAQQAEQLRILEEDRRRAHASMIAVWPVEEGGELRCRVQNRSGLPVYAALIFQSVPDESDDWWCWKERSFVVPPGTRDYEWQDSGQYPFVVAAHQPQIEPV